jgi:tetratricopeptide (TPR) repeat protein
MRTTAVTVILGGVLVGCVSQPEPGAERGRCRPQGTCNEGLTCLSDVCVKVPEDLCAKRAPKAGAVTASRPATTADAGGVPTPPLSEQDLLTAKRLLKQARVAYIRGRHKEAIPLVKKVLKLHPDNAMATQILGASSCYLKDVDQARWAYDRLTPKSQDLLKNICLRVGINLE